MTDIRKYIIIAMMICFHIIIAMRIREMRRRNAAAAAAFLGANIMIKKESFQYGKVYNQSKNIIRVGIYQEQEDMVQNHNAKCGMRIFFQIFWCYINQPPTKHFELSRASREQFGNYLKTKNSGPLVWETLKHYLLCSIAFLKSQSH